MKPADFETIGKAAHAAFQACCSAKTDAEVSVAHCQLGRVLAHASKPAAAMSSSGVRRGPKPRHDRQWAIETLLAMVGPDGLFEKQEASAARLRQQFIDAGRLPPSRTWLRNLIRDLQTQELVRMLERQDAEELLTIADPLFRDIGDRACNAQNTEQLERKP